MITATATDTFGETSEFSQCLNAPVEALRTSRSTRLRGAPTVCSDGDCSLGDAITVANATPSSIESRSVRLPGVPPYTITPTPSSRRSRARSCSDGYDAVRGYARHTDRSGRRSGWVSATSTGVGSQLVPGRHRAGRQHDPWALDHATSAAWGSARPGRRRWSRATTSASRPTERARRQRRRLRRRRHRGRVREQPYRGHDGRARERDLGQQAPPASYPRMAPETS